MKPIHFVSLLLLGAIWGASFLFIGIAVVEFGPPVLMLLRVLVGGLLLMAIAYLSRQNTREKVSLQLREKWHNYLVLGLLNSALPFTLIAFSELRITVSLAAILNSTTPLFAAVAASIGGSEQFTRRKISGIFLGILGVGVLMGGSPLERNTEFAIAVIASLLAALCYGTATVYASKHVKDLPPIYAAIVQLMSAALILTPAASITIPSELPGLQAFLALSALIVFSTTCAYLLYFFLLQQIGPTRTASVTFLAPVFGSIWGVILLHDLFSLGMVFGTLIIFTSISFVMGIQWQRKR